MASVGLGIVGADLSLDLPLTHGIALGAGGLSRFTIIAGDMETFATARLTHVLWHHPDGWTLAQMWSVSRKWNQIGGRVRDAFTKWTAEPAALITVPLKFPPAFEARVRLAVGPAFLFGSLFEPNVLRYGDPPELPPGSNEWLWGVDLANPSWRFAGEIAVPLNEHWEVVYGGGSFTALRGVW